MSVTASSDAGAWPEEMELGFYADTSLTIPGVGDRPSDCGEFRPMTFCDSGHVQIKPHKCQQRGCPDCWSTWRVQAAESITARLGGARQAAETGLEKRLVHVVESPEPGTVRTITQFNSMISDSYDLAREKGIRGGVAIAHGWRVKEDVKAAFRELLEADAVSGGIWKWIRENPRQWRSQVYWSPHVHILGLSEDVGENKPEEQDGWVVKRIDSFSAWNIHDMESYEDMFRASAYLLSHLAFDPEARQHSVRWFGEVANNKFSLEQLQDWEKSVIERHAAEVAGQPYEEDGDGEASEPCECDRDDCSAATHPIWDASLALADKQWCDEIGRDREREVRIAFEWAIGDISLPPGMKHPRTEEHATEAFGHLLDNAL